MKSLLAYSGLTTKIKGMDSKLITPEQYGEIMSLASVSEVVEYLKRLPEYREILENIDSKNLHRGELERYLILSSYRDFGKIYNFSSIKQRKFLELYFMKYETHLLKIILREILDRNTVTVNINDVKPYFNRFSKINLDALVSSTTIEEFINALNNTKFYAPLRRTSALDHTTLFDYELCLDLFYFQTMWKNKDKYLSGYDLEVITASCGYKIDLLNMQWILRCKKFYNVSHADIYSMLIPIRYKVKRDELKAMIDAENEDTFYAIFNNTFYHKKIKLERINSMETVYRIINNALHKRAFEHKPYSIACVDTFLHKKQQEISKLITLTECVRYAYTHDEIMKVLE